MRAVDTQANLSVRIRSKGKERQQERGHFFSWPPCEKRPSSPSSSWNALAVKIRTHQGIPPFGTHGLFSGAEEDARAEVTEAEAEAAGGGGSSRNFQRLTVEKETTKARRSERKKGEKEFAEHPFWRKKENGIKGSAGIGTIPRTSRNLKPGPGDRAKHSNVFVWRCV